ncbi:MAG: aminotransferase class I/II-fold pyridoxal phosphate-dependent enzyme, partial [Lachnospiraceae bacterium]|nr:aminotransferase class I/II-fold pyridoxal phosphate-dependent enzyme [Lachnospiraceae bacterium]
SPVEDEHEFVEYLKNNEQILVVPGRSFGCAGWVRIAYCVSHETIQNSLPGFERCAQHYGL